MKGGGGGFSNFILKRPGMLEKQTVKKRRLNGQSYSNNIKGKLITDHVLVMNNGILYHS